MEGWKVSNGLEASLLHKLQLRREKSTFRQLTTSVPNAVDFSSNDFLSLSTSSVLRKAFLDELSQNTSNFSLGSTGSRLLDGNCVYADELESSIAKFHRAPAGLLWNSGFDANSGLFACVPQSGDYILYDEWVHASVHDGLKLSRAKITKAFTHNSVPHLRESIQDLLQSDSRVLDGSANIFVAVETVYSMDGDLAPLAEIVCLVEELLPRRNGHIVVDEAHATGVLGPSGRGLVCKLGLEDKIFARLHTFGKALASNGAIVLCTPVVRSYLINYAKPLIYTTFLSFPSLACICAGYSLLSNGYAEELVVHLHFLIRHFHLSLHKMLAKYEPCRGLLKESSAKPNSPIFALETDHPRKLAKHCQENGFVVRAVVPPTVPTRRVRAGGMH
ncbi:MAG: hypothetical protein M1820_005383 [Bogoriella megaspora]|nr:MAG: hypothetical protein M1820_005383 [Bogoriella megaspora]